MAKGTDTGVRVKRDPNYIYYVDGAGRVLRSPRKCGSKRPCSGKGGRSMTARQYRQLWAKYERHTRKSKSSHKAMQRSAKKFGWGGGHR